MFAWSSGAWLRTCTRHAYTSIGQQPTLDSLNALQVYFGINAKMPLDGLLRHLLHLHEILHFRFQLLEKQMPQQLLSQLLTSFPSNSLHASATGRRLQNVQSCRHDVPYFIRVVTSNRTRANEAMPAAELSVGGQRFRQIFLPARSVNNLELGQTLESQGLYLSRRPDTLTIAFDSHIFAVQTRVYGWRQIVLLHGGETTTIIDSPNGQEIGDNEFWVGGPRSNIATERRFVVPSTGNLSSTTTTTFVTRPGEYTLEVVQSGQEFASGNFGPEVLARFQIPTGPTSSDTRSFNFLPERTITGAARCRAVTVSLSRRPT